MWSKIGKKNQVKQFEKEENTKAKDREEQWKVKNTIKTKKNNNKYTQELAERGKKPEKEDIGKGK